MLLSQWVEEAVHLISFLFGDIDLRYIFFDLIAGSRTVLGGLLPENRGSCRRGNQAWKAASRLSDSFGSGRQVHA